ncbi:MAG: general secretion pathway protein GspK [Planctomycetales bacterium]|nr:general secretion pathway protein GspK [Planctomycetales bacterium]
MRCAARNPSTPRPHRGVVLIIVLVVVAILALGAYTFTELMISHDEAALLGGRQVQARALVDSGLDATSMFLAMDPLTQEEMGGWYDNPTYFQAVNVIPDPDPAAMGNFTLIAANQDDEGNLAGVRYGLEDESTRLNLNTLLFAEENLEGAGRTLLMSLPGMTEDVADAILDWIDEDDEPREYGCEVEYYSALSPPYRPKNGPMDTVEELLLVRGVTPLLLFGLDINHNGNVEPHEMASATEMQSAVDITTLPPRGWSSFLTLHSKEKNVMADGQPRIHLNNADLNELYTDLREVFDESWASFIVAYRQSGPYSGSGPAGNAQGARPDLAMPAEYEINQVWDLIDIQVEMQPGGGGNPIVLDSPFSGEFGAMAAYLPTLLDKVSVNGATTIPGRININQAPRTIMLGIPGMTEEIVDQIIELREPVPTEENPNRKSEAWLLLEAVVTLEQMRILSPFVCAGGSVYRAQVIGYFEGGGASARGEAIFDATKSVPRLVFWRDVSHLGRGYDLGTLGMAYSDPLLTGIGN